jgi:serine/threonine protein kinase
LSISLPIDSVNNILGGRYYLHELVAQKNYSRIFLATDITLHRKCALKQLYPDFCSTKMQSKIKSTFLQEVEISQEIAGKHPQLCQFYSYFIESDERYLVGEWIEGDTLEEKLRQQSRLSELETKFILSSILLVLRRIHSLGIVHNDIKPSNIILRQEDRLPVLIDFGIARKIDRDYRQKTIAGTPGYMSLEQAMGKSAVTNDLYSLGMMAIYLLTGSSPHTIDFNSPQDNFWQQAKTALDPQLVAIVDRAIALEPSRRFDSADEMWEMLHHSPEISKTTLIDRQRNLSKLKYLSAILMLTIAANIWVYYKYLMPQANSKPPVNITDLQPDRPLNLEEPKDKPLNLLPPSEDKPESKILATNNALKNVIFVPGTSATTIVSNLGEPIWRREGFWANSIAWAYQDRVTKGIDLGYILDNQTNRLRQAEIAVPPATDLSTLKIALDSLLRSNTVHPDIQQGLKNIYHRRQNTYEFTVENLQGIIQRNAEDRIYMAVWEADFH